MFTRIRVAIDERVVAVKNGVPLRAFGPGAYTLWKTGVTTHRFDTNDLVFSAPASVRAVLPADWYGEAVLDSRERGVLYRDGRPVAFLRPGVHRFWTVDPSVTLAVLSIDEPVPALTDELRAVIPDRELIVATVFQHQRGLLYVRGSFERMLEPGQHGFWSHPEAPVVVKVVDVRQQQLQIVGQDLMTRDKVTLRLTLSAEFTPSDAPTATHAVENLEAAVYLMVQLAAREYVAGVTLDELLEGRGEMATQLEADVVPKARALGVEVHRVGVKDVVLPGDMKALLNRVIEAEKQAAANVILRREEAQATRTMANAARVMADNPVLLELKRLEAFEKIAGNIDGLEVALGNTRGLLETLGIADKKAGDSTN